MAVLFSIVLVCGILFATRQENTYTSLLQKENVEALSNSEYFQNCEVEMYACDFSINGQISGEIIGLTVTTKGDGRISIDGGVNCKSPGSYVCKMVTCSDIWMIISGH